MGCFVKYLHEGARFLLTRRLNQDALEHFFSIIRSCGGFRDNPTPYEFLHAFKQASVNHLLLPVCSGNCSVDVAQLVPILLAAAPRCRDRPTSLPTRPIMSLTAVHVWQLTDPTAMWRTAWRYWRATVLCTLQGTGTYRSDCMPVTTVTRPHSPNPPSRCRPIFSAFPCLDSMLASPAKVGSLFANPEPSLVAQEIGNFGKIEVLCSPEARPTRLLPATIKGHGANLQWLLRHWPVGE